MLRKVIRNATLLSISDATGASIPGAAITAEDLDTAYTYKAVSAPSGEWTISPVRIGTYKVTVSANGFRTTIVNPITLDVQQRQRVDVQLEVGQVSETTTVRETAPLLENETSERGQVIKSGTMVGLPLNGRNPVQLAQLTAGVTVSQPGARDETGYGFSANGARSLENNFLLDGIDNNSNLPDLLNEANYVVMPSVDALQEFKVETDSYNAEFGRATGAIVNATLKSGTNEFHGVLYEFLRNQHLDARNFFDPSVRPYHQNQFGATLGGPIVRDKLFFFGDYEGLRVRQSQTDTSLVPTAAQRSGDFSSQLNLSAPTGVSDCNGNMTYAGELFDTTATQPSAASPTGYCGVPFRSETHVFSPTLVNELRLGYNRLHSSRFQFNYNQNVSGSVGFPGVPYVPGTNNGGLPQLTFSDVSTLGAPTYLPSNEIQNTYTASDTLTSIHGNHSVKFGGEFRPEEFTIFQPADPRGSISFGRQFTDNAGAPGSGGSGFATLLSGQPDGGYINNLNNLDYLRHNFSLFAQDDWRVTRKFTLNIGLR